MVVSIGKKCNAGTGPVCRALREHTACSMAALRPLPIWLDIGCGARLALKHAVGSAWRIDSQSLPKLLSCEAMQMVVRVAELGIDHQQALEVVAYP